MKKLAYLATAAVALSLVGCATDEPAQIQTAPEPAPVELIDTSVPNVRIAYENEKVATALKVVNVRMTKNGEFPKLVFQLLNYTKTKFPVEYKVQWLDMDGAPLQSTAAWQQTTVAAQEAKPVVSMGRATNAVSAQITIRFPNNVEIFVPTPDPAEKMRIEREVIDEYNARLSRGELKQ